MHLTLINKEWQWRGVYRVNERHSVASRINTPIWDSSCSFHLTTENYSQTLQNLRQFDMVFWQITPVMSICSGKMSQWVKSVKNCTASLYETAPTTQIPPSIPAASGDKLGSGSCQNTHCPWDNPDNPIVVLRDNVLTTLWPPCVGSMWWLYYLARARMSPSPDPMEVVVAGSVPGFVWTCLSQVLWARAYFQYTEPGIWSLISLLFGKWPVVYMF